MEVVSNNTLLPGDPRLIEHIVCELKSQGIFDQFRKECIDDVDTKPAYQNLRQRVEGSVTGFLKTQKWRPDMNKNQLREMLRKNIYESGFLETGVERIVDQVVYPKINSVFLPQVEDVVYNFLGLEKPIRNISTINGPLTINTIDLLPTDLDPISPDSEVMDKSLNKSDKSNDDTDKLDDSKNDEFESPPFEPITEQSVFSAHEDSSNDSHLSGISGLTSHDSNLSSQDSKLNIFSLDVVNQDSQLSKVSSNSRLSIITTDSKHASEKMDISDDTQTSRSSNAGEEAILNLEEPKDRLENVLSHFNIKPDVSDEIAAIRIEINEHQNGKQEMENEEQCETEMDIDEDSQMSVIESQTEKTLEEVKTFGDESEEIMKESLEKEMEELKMNVSASEDSIKVELEREFCEETRKVVSLEENNSKDAEENGSKSGLEDLKTEDSQDSVAKAELKVDSSEKDTELKKHDSTDDSAQFEVKKSDSKSEKSDRARHDSDRKHSSRSESRDKKDDRRSDKDRKDKDRNRSNSSSKDKDKYRDKSKDSRSKDSSKSKDDKGSKAKEERESSKSASKDDKSRSSSSSKYSRDRSSSKSESKSSKDRSETRSKASTNSKPKEDKPKSEENKASKSEETRKSDSSKKAEDSKRESSDLKKSSKSDEPKSASKSEDSKSSRSRDRSRSDAKATTGSRDRKSSSSKDHKDRKDPKKSSKRDKDDHSSSRDKKSDNRRSADRDSNDGSSGIGNNSNSNSSKDKETSSAKSSENSNDSSQGSNSGDSGQSDNSQTSHCLNQTEDGAAIKTPVTILTETLRDKYEVTISPATVTDCESDTMPHVKIMKPKFASNIFEARRLMKVRKKWEKLERRRQRQLMQGTKELEVDSPSIEDSDSVDSGCLQIVEQDESKEDLELENTTTEHEKSIRDESTATPTTSVVSKESWDALEAKLSLNVDYDSYIDENCDSSSSTKTKHSRRSSDEEDCLYFMPQILPKTERYLKKIASLQRDGARLAIVLEDCRKMAPPHMNSDVPAKRARKTNQKYMIDEGEPRETVTVKKTTIADGKHSATIKKKTKGRKRKLDGEIDGFYSDNNNKKTNNHFDDMSEDYEEVMEPSPSASNTSNGSIELTTKIKPPVRSKKTKKTNSVQNETFPLPLSPESDVSASSVEVRNVGQDVTAPVKTPRASIKKSQRYSSDDLYKPRPFVSVRSRRQRGLLDSTDNIDPSAKLRR